MLEEKGEKEVRRALAKGEYGGPGEKKGHDVALSWLESKRSAREEKTLNIAKEANHLAFEANSIARSQASAAWRAARYAMYAAIIAAIGAISANKDDIYELIAFLFN